MSHHIQRTAPKPRAVIGTPWFIRKAVYVIVTIVGLVCVLLGWVQPDQVDNWVTQASIIAAQLTPLAAVIGGGMAAMNTGWESDEKPVGTAAAPAPGFDGFTAYPQEVHRAD